MRDLRISWTEYTGAIVGTRIEIQDDANDLRQATAARVHAHKHALHEVVAVRVEGREVWRREYAHP